MWLNVILAKLILSQCLWRSPWQIFLTCKVASLACLAHSACVWVLVTILEVAYSAAHFGSLLWVDHCFGCQFAVALIPSWSLQITALVVDFANLGQGSFQVADKYPHWSFFSVRVLVDGHLQGWFLLTRLPWKLPAAPCIFPGPIYQPLMAPVPKLIYWARV